MNVCGDSLGIARELPAALVRGRLVVSRIATKPWGSAGPVDLLGWPATSWVAISVLTGDRGCSVVARLPSQRDGVVSLRGANVMLGGFLLADACALVGGGHLLSKLVQ